MSLLQAQLERININTQDIVQKCEEVSGRYGKKKGHLCHLLRKITFATWYFFFFISYYSPASFHLFNPKYNVQDLFRLPSVRVLALAMRYW